MTKQNKRWMKLKDRAFLGYLKGLEDFLEFVFSRLKPYGRKPNQTIKYPCHKCNIFL